MEHQPLPTFGGGPTYVGGGETTLDGGGRTRIHCGGGCEKCKGVKDEWERVLEANRQLGRHSSTAELLAAARPRWMAAAAGALWMAAGALWSCSLRGTGPCRSYRAASCHGVVGSAHNSGWKALHYALQNNLSDQTLFFCGYLIN